MTRLKTSFATWLLLVAATLLSFVSWLDAKGANGRLPGSLVIAIALAKAWIIGRRFMELDEAVWPIRLIFNCWIALVGAVLIVMFWQAP